jgi:hypothetical protein
MSDGFIVDLPYKFELFDGTITTFSLKEPSSYLGIGIIDLPINQNNTSVVAAPHLGIGIVENPITSIRPARLSANKLGIGIVDAPIIDTNICEITPPYLGIGIVNLPITHNNIASLAPSYLGIGVIDRKITVNNVAIIGPRYLGIGIADKKLVYDNRCGTETSKNNSKKLRFVCAQNTIDIQVPKVTPENWLFKNLSAFTMVEPPKNVKNMDNWLADDLRKDKNNPNHPEKEASRLLTHLIFDPIDKPVISTWYLTYTLEIEVEQTDKREVAHIATPTTSQVFEFNATNASTIWTIHHQLAFIPKVDVFINNVFYIPKSITHLDVNTTVINFETAQIGMARFY